MQKTGFQRQIAAETIKLAIKGDVRAFEDIYNSYASASFTLAYRMTYSRAAAEDISQEAFLKVFKNISSYHFSGSFPGWVRKVVVNEAISHLRAKQKLNLLFDNELPEKEPHCLFDTSWAIDVLTLDSYLAKLSPICRSVLLLHEVEGYKHTEIGALFDKSQSFSKMALKRAYSELKDIIEIEERRSAS